MSLISSKNCEKIVCINGTSLIKYKQGATTMPKKIPDMSPTEAADLVGRYLKDVAPQTRVDFLIAVEPIINQFKTAKERSLAEEYLICKVRGHEEDYDAPSLEIAGHDGYKHQCIHCKCYFWTEDVLHEDNVPSYQSITKGKKS